MKDKDFNKYDGRYDDIIMLPHPESKKHIRMKSDARAAQFAPFAALTGYEDAVKETARITEGQIELDEAEREVLDAKIHQLQAADGMRSAVKIVYYEADMRKAGGKYITVTGRIKKIDYYRKVILLEDGNCIHVEDIRDLECVSCED